MKLCSRNTASGSAKIECATQIDRNGNASATAVPEKIRRRGMSAICSGTICSAKTSTNTVSRPFHCSTEKA